MTLLRANRGSYACSLLGQTNSGASCNAIGGNGTSGTYGPLQMCSPAIKLSYAMSAYYEYNPISTSCDFGQNASLSSTRESDSLAAQSGQCSSMHRPEHGARCFDGRPVMSRPTAFGRRVHPSALGVSYRSQPVRNRRRSVELEQPFSRRAHLCARRNRVRPGRSGRRPGLRAERRRHGSVNTRHSLLGFRKFGWA